MRASNVTKAVALALSVAWVAGCSTSDERGTREYNMALGERRAKAVSRFLQVNGVSGSQVESISFGEEKPAVLGHSDSSWSQNRRVELKYVSR